MIARGFARYTALMTISSRLRPIYEVLTQSHADLEREGLLGDGFRTALWLRQRLEDTVYDHPQHHTISLYLEDGFDVYLQGQPDRRGAPGKLCLLPAQHQSHWRINGRIRFLHFYFTPQQFDRLALRMLDREPRSVDLQQRIYIDDPRLAAACRYLAQLHWQTPNQRLEANALGHEILAHLLLQHTNTPRGLKLKGGLAPVQRRRALEMIDARLNTPLTVGALADELAMSEYHFARMFRRSVGVAPHRWIIEQRLARARVELAAGRLSLDGVANAAGFSHVSHLTRHLRGALGVTPGEYRRWALERPA